MNRLPLSAAASGLLRSLLARAPQDRDRILLTESQSVDWQSLTFVGERHEFRFRVPGPNAARIVGLLTEGMSDAEFAIPRHIVADITLSGEPRAEHDGSVSFGIEALTIQE